VQYRPHLLRSEVDHRLTIVAAHEAVAVLVAFDLALDLAQQRRARGAWGRMDGFFDDKISG
jgi:hypothetical protein